MRDGARPRETSSSSRRVLPALAGFVDVVWLTRLSWHRPLTAGSTGVPFASRVARRPSPPPPTPRPRLRRPAAAPHAETASPSPIRRRPRGAGGPAAAAQGQRGAAAAAQGQRGAAAAAQGQPTNCSDFERRRKPLFGTTNSPKSDSGIGAVGRNGSDFQRRSISDYFGKSLVSSTDSPKSDSGIGEVGRNGSDFQRRSISDYF